MPNLLSMSFEGELAPSFDLRCLRPGRTLPDGWGIGYFPGGEPSAVVLKEAAPPQGSIRSELVKAWEHLESSLFVLHIRRARWGALSDANTQPFEHSWGGRNWLIGHSGSLRYRVERRTDARFEPVGSTDTEVIFCEILERLADLGAKSLGDCDPQLLRSWFGKINTHGSLSMVLTDGRDLVVYADVHGEGSIHLWELYPPHGRIAFGDEDLEVDLTKRGIKSRKGIIVCSDPLESKSETPVKWQRLDPGHLVVIRQGAIRARVAPPPPPAHGEMHDPTDDEALPRPVPKSMRIILPKRAEITRYDVRHRTSYTYTEAVERSTHVLRLVPVHDRLQTLLAHELSISVDGQVRDYDDVFGNRVKRVLLERPFTELIIDARSTVELLDTDPLSYRPIHARSSIPLVWMPWQRHMLDPYLLPPELPESQLSELVEYAMSFVERNDYDLLDTLLDLNSSIYKEYTYEQGATTLLTTPFDVYANRLGVCQDFANLFICLARLLGVPARYACGYIYTGPKAENQRQGEASHAWVQVYLPEVGWKGFDPTNGILTQTEHVRVSVGRNYVDATPTSGTLYVGGAGETLAVDVRVERSKR